MCIKEVASRFSFSELLTFVLSVLSFVFLTSSLSPTSSYFFKSTGLVFNLPTSKSSTIVFKLIKLVGTLVGLLISSFSNSAVKAAKSF